MKKIYSFILLLLLLAFRNTSANDIISERISLEEGVPNNLIYSVYQDSKGFIWFGTMFGLVRYDGRNYKTFRYDPNDTNSISNDDIVTISEDKDGNIWTGTYNGGLNRYDRTTGKFTRFLNDPGQKNSIGANTIWGISQDKDGDMWFATEGGGLNKYVNGGFTSYKRDTTKAGSISGNFIRSVLADRNGNIWAGTFASGINKFDKEKNTFTNYRFEPFNSNGSHNFVNTIFEDSDGEIWAGTGLGLNRFDYGSASFKKYLINERSGEVSGSNNILHIAEDSPGVLLVGTQSGLYRFHKDTGSFEKIKLNLPADESTKPESVISFVKDRSGVIWASSYSNGLFKITEPSYKFGRLASGKNIRCIFQDKKGNIWMGTEMNGLLSSSDSGKTFASFISSGSESSLSSNRVNSITEDSRGYLWIATANGINRMDVQRKTFFKYYSIPGSKSSPSSNNILRILCDKAGVVWAGTDNGLNRYNEADQTFTQYLHKPGDTNSIGDNTIISMYEDSMNNLFVGTYKGLDQLDRKKGIFRHYRKNPSDPKSISNNYVFSYCEDLYGNFWIGTGGGLNIFDRNAGTFLNYTEKDDLPNMVIAGIESDNSGELWISTYKGISSFNFKNKTYRNYDSYDGLLSNMFNNGAYFKNGSGRIYFGSINGVNYFDPSGLKLSAFDAPVVLTSLEKFDGRNRTEADISAIAEYETSYKNNVIKFSFAAMDHSNPAKNKFEYKLEGFDENWIKSSDGEAVYTNLDPGSYIFRVKGTNSDGVFSKKEATLNLIITPPFWKTLWFYVLAGAGLIAGIVMIQNYRIRKKVERTVEIEKVRQHEREQMREQASRDYHDELGHKLTRISLYSRRINKKLRPTANGLTSDLNHIVETSNSLQSGAKDLIWAMNPGEDTLYDLAVRLKNFGSELFENTGINFIAGEINPEMRKICLSMNSKRHIVFIFKEGMNNILKYSRAPKAELTFTLDENRAEITLEDDGIGFNTNDSSTGYGLKNIYNRAKQINADVVITSGADRGTTIKFTSMNDNLITA